MADVIDENENLLQNEADNEMLPPPPPLRNDNIHLNNPPPGGNYFEVSIDVAAAQVCQVVEAKIARPLSLSLFFLFFFFLFFFFFPFFSKD
jgi:hypothetical protein